MRHSRESPLRQGPGDAPFAKRAFDIVLVLVTLPITVSVLLITSLAILILSGRPIFYRSHRRVWLDRGQTIIKFRAMVRNAASIANRQTVPIGDQCFLNLPLSSPLYTGIGRLIERCSLTELPQLIHVIRGSMSIVGNRPLPEDVMAVLKARYPDSDDRFLIRAGLCGPIQVLGRDVLGDEERLRIEGAYARWCLTNYSAYVDLKILVFTILKCLGLQRNLFVDRLERWFDLPSRPESPGRRKRRPAPIPCWPTPCWPSLDRALAAGHRRPVRFPTAAPRVSVIMNLWNGQEFLREAIDSVLAQGYQDWELIVFDDRSTDDSVRIVRTYDDPRIRYVAADRWLPLGEARNAAARLARGEWIAWLDQDDVWHPDKLEAQMHMIDEDGGRDVGLVYGRTVRFDGRGRERCDARNYEFRPLPEGNVHLALLEEGSFIAMSSALVSREAWDAIGGTPEGIDSAVDYWMFTAISRRFRTLALQWTCCRYRQHGGSMMNSWGTRVFNETCRITDAFASSIPVELHRRRRRIWHTLIGVEMIRGDRRPLAGLIHILDAGSLPYLFSRPLAWLGRALKRRSMRRRIRLSPPLVLRSGHGHDPNRVRQDGHAGPKRTSRSGRLTSTRSSLPAPLLRRAEGSDS